MANPLYYSNEGPFTLQELVEACEGSLTYQGPQSDWKSLMVADVGGLRTAKASRTLSLCAMTSYVLDLKSTLCGFCVVSEALSIHVPDGVGALISSRPQRDFATICQLFYPQGGFIPLGTQEALIHPEAHIDPSAQLGQGVCVYKNAVIGKGVKIGPYSVIGPGVHVGSGCHIGPHVSVYYAHLDPDVYIGPGTRIGQEGFGFIADAQGHVPLPQIGGVVIEEGVHIGANVTIDRGSLDDTQIGRGSRIDNLVQVAHNVVLGAGCVLVAQVGVAGSTRFGQHVMVGGQAGFAPHLTIGSGAQIAAQSGVMHNIEEKNVVSGSPSLPIQEWRKLNVMLRRLVRTGSFGKNPS